MKWIAVEFKLNDFLEQKERVIIQKEQNTATKSNIIHKEHLQKQT